MQQAPASFIAPQGGIDRNDPRPLHRQVYEALLASIRDGKLPLRGKLPSERELVDLYNVSRITVRHAVRELVQQGVIHSQPGKGLYQVRCASITLDRFCSFPQADTEVFVVVTEGNQSDGFALSIANQGIGDGIFRAQQFGHPLAAEKSLALGVYDPRSC